MASLQSTSVNGTLSATGAVTLSNYGAGFVKLNASGAIVIDTNSYLTSGSFLPLSGGTMSGNISTNSLFVRTAAGAGWLSGNYSNAETTATSGAIYSIGGSYVPGSTNLGNMYGIGYTYGGVAGLGGTSNWGLYVAAAGTARIFLDADNGIGTATNSWRAPVFYDSANTTYFWDGNAGKSMEVAGGIQLDGLNNSNAYIAFNNASTYWGIIGNYSSNDWRIGIGNYGSMVSWNLRWDASGNAWANSSFRAPIFYDSDDTTYYLDPANGSTSGYFAAVLRQNAGKYVRDSNYRIISGYSDYYSGGSAGWYKVAQITLTANCSGAVLFGTLNDNRYDGADAYQISVVARAECDFTSNNESHYINVGCTILGSTNYSNYQSKIRVLLVASSSGSRTYELQFYETAWNHDTWELQTQGNWTIYSSPQAPGSSTGTARVNYISKKNADYIYANTEMYSPRYYDSQDSSYYADPNDQSRFAALKIGNQSTFNSGATYALQLSHNNRYLLALCYNNSSYYPWLVNDSWNGYEALIFHYNGIGDKFYFNRAGQMLAAGDVRAPIFYDSDNTGYYVDPNSTSVLYYLQLNAAESMNLYGIRGRFTNEYIHLYNKVGIGHPGGWGQGEGNTPSQGLSTYGGINIAYGTAAGSTFNGTLTVNTNANQVAYFQSPNANTWVDIISTTRTWSMGSTSGSTWAIYDRGSNTTRMEIDTGSNLYAYGSMRSPIFYDSQDTGYYLDLNSTSNTALRIRGGALHGPNPTWGKYLYVGTDGRVGSTATVAVTNGNLHIDCEDGYALYLNWYSTNNIYSRGNFGVGSDSASYRLHVHGTGYATSDFRAPIFYDSDNTGYYGDFASTSRLNVLDANSIYTSGGLSTNGGNSLLGVQSPGGASRANGGSTETGAFKITLPSGIPVYGMFKLVIHIYEYGQRGNGYEIHCGGHMYPNYMYNRFQVQYGSSNSPLNVRYGNDGTNGCIWIGDTNTTWSYPQIWVSEFMMGYSNTSWTTWRSGWSISLVTSYGNSGAMDGPYTCDFGYAASAGSASTSSQVSINYNNDSNSTYQLLWGSGNSVYGTGGVYVNPYDDRVYANYFSSAYYMDVYTSAGSDYLRITDNQVYRPGGGGLYLNWSSNANVFITGSGGGYIGVGNNSPSYKLHVSGDIYANGGWLRVSGSSGLYFESYGGGWRMTGSSYIESYGSKSLHMNGASVDYVGSLYFSGAGHIQPNAGSYGALQMTSTKGGWAGIRFTDTENNLMMNSNESGHHRNGYGWQFRWYNGGMYISTNAQGGGSEYQVLHAGNYTSWAAPRNYVGDSYVDFYIYGDANTYYPVTIQNYNNGYGFQRYSIHRGYSWTAPWDPIGTGSHKGGLTFTFEWAGDIAWGGNDKSFRIIEFSEQYTTMVAGMQLAHCEGLIVWLRGGGSGGAHYRLHGPGGIVQGYSINMSSWTSCASVTYSPRSYDSGTVNSEINSRYPIRGSGSGDIYVSNQAVIHSGNIGSQSVSYASSAGNADTVDGYHASNFLGKNGNTYYQQDTWIQLNGAHGLYAPSYNGAHWLPNTASTYTTWRISGSRNGYSGIHDDYSNLQMVMFDGSGNGGTYREANGRWYWYHHVGNNCTAINTSTTSSSYRAYIGGSLYAEGDIVAYSDARKKTDIVTIDNALEKVSNLRGVYYTRIDDPDRGRQTGVIAQEINKVLPEVVTYAADVDEYGVSYGNIVGVLIEAIKEQQKQIEELKTKLNGLTS